MSLAGLARDIATGIAQFIAQRQARQPFDREALANAARRIEEKADKIVIKARDEIARFDADPTVEQLVNRAEEAIDELEQAAFLTSLLPGELAPDLLKPLAELCTAAVCGAEAAQAFRHRRRRQYPGRAAGRCGGCAGRGRPADRSRT